MATYNDVNRRWQEQVAHAIETSPTRWAMLTRKQREFLRIGFFAGYGSGSNDGYVKGEADTEHAAAVLAVTEPTDTYNWAMGRLKHSGFVTGFKVIK